MSRIDVNGVSFTYGDHLVLDNVSFSTCGRELLAVLGPNGVGKSTLFSCILAIQPVKTGSILLDGQPVHQIPASKLAQRIAYVPQSHAPVFNYSVFDMVLMGTTARVGGFSAPCRRELDAAHEALEQVGIPHLAGRGYLQISGGERQLTLIARALAQRAEVIIMDEPTANLDYGNTIKILSCVKGLADQGYTIIESTHNPNNVFLFADRVLALNEGKLIAHGPPRETLTPSLINDLYGVEVRLNEGSDGHISIQPILRSPKNPHLNRKEET